MAVGTTTQTEDTDRAAAGTGQSLLAARYAGALYDLAAERRVLDAVVAEIDQIGRTIDADATLRRLLESPLVRAGEARDGLLAVLRAAGCSELVQHFVGVVATNRRLASLRAITRAFAALVASRRGIVTAEVASAHPLSDVQRHAIGARLAEAGYSNVRIDERLDPSLIGGLSLRIGARLYDASIKSRLQRLAYRMKGAA